VDGSHFDVLARQYGSRRTAVGGLLAGLLLPLDAARGKNKRRKRKGKENRKGVAAQEVSCWRAGACILKKGANISRCDLEGYDPSTPLDCTGCNLSRANLRGADLSGVNLTRANLSGSCLVNANLKGAIVAGSTNLYDAIFCNTTMPNGSINNSGCLNGTACCPTTSCTTSGTCVTPAQICLESGYCANCSNLCSSSCAVCLQPIGGGTVCAGGTSGSCADCSADSECRAGRCLIGSTSIEGNEFLSASAICGRPIAEGACLSPLPCLSS